MLSSVSIFVDDDDTTTQAHLHQNVPYGVEKWSDVIHAKRSLTTRLYNLSSRCPFPDSSTLSQKVINFLAKCFSYCIAQNSDVDSLKLALKCIVPHAFGEHQSCNPSWCGYWKDPLLYTHKYLAYNKELYCFTHNNFMDKKLEKDKKRKSNKKLKIKRHQLQSQ